MSRKVKCRTCGREVRVSPAGYLAKHNWMRHRSRKRCNGSGVHIRFNGPQEF